MDDKLRARITGDAGSLDAFSGSDGLDWISGFLKSTVESIPEVFGVTPSIETQDWRQDYPVSGFASEMVGMAVPYGGWLKAAGSIPKFAKAIDKIGDAVNSPVATGFKREIARFAPFEVGRVAASQLIGDETLGTEVTNSIINLGIGGGIGGIIGGVAAAGLKEPTVAQLLPGIDIAAPVPLQARHAQKLIDDGVVPPDYLPRVQYETNQLLRRARLEELSPREKYVAPIQHDLGGLKIEGGKLEQDLNRWFRPTENVHGKALQIRKFARGTTRDFPDKITWAAEADAAGLPKNFARFGQYFRSIGFNPELASTKVAKHVDNRITRNMTPVGDNWFMTREADDGMFIMAKKYKGEIGKAENTDKWILFKTDTPGTFAKTSDGWQRGMVGLHKWLPGTATELDYGVVGNSLKGFAKQYPIRNYQSFGSPSMLARAIEKITPNNVVGKQSELFSRFKAEVKGALAPRIFQFNKSWRGNWIVQAAKVAYDAADNVANEVMNGVMSVDPGKSLWHQVLRNDTKGPLGVPSVREAVMKVPEDKFQSEFYPLWRDEIAPGTKEYLAKFKAGEISPEVDQLAKALSIEDAFTTGNITKVEEAVGKRKTDWRLGHYGVSRSWEGDTRIVLREGKQVVALASGPNKRAAIANAQELARQNPTWNIGETFSISEMQKKIAAGEAVPDAIRPIISSPSFLLERQGLKGYKWGSKAFTRDEFLEAKDLAIRARTKYQANLTVNDLLMPQLKRLQQEDPTVYNQVVQRLNNMEGVQSDWGRMQNQFVDNILAPMLGENSATKIVGYTNTALFNLQLGAGNLIYPVSNLVTFMQTVNPEVAFLMSAPDARLAPYYAHFAAGGTKGPVGGMAVLEPIRIAGRALMEMSKPSKELLDAYSWAMNNRTIDPRLVEGYIGESATKIADLKSVLSGDASFASWVRALSEWLPANSERLSRTHAFTVGYMAARDLLRSKTGGVLTEEARRQFAKQFTENTMYLYGAADKPKLFTTPAGSALGLFKNWMFHYMGQMINYSKEGVLHNNWAPLLWQTTGTFTVGGLSATPVYWAAEAFSQMFADKSMLELSYDSMNKDVADGVIFGLPAAITGISMSSMVDAPGSGSNPVRDAAGMFSIAAWGRVKAAQAGIMGTAFDRWQATGEHPGSDPLVKLQLARAFAPNTIYKMISSLSDQNIYSSTTGYPHMQDVPAYQRLLYGFGFNPVELEKAFMVSNELYSNREKHKAQVANLGRNFALAQARGDSNEMALILRQAIVWGIDSSSVIRSAMIRTRHAQTDLIRRGYKPADILRFENVIGDYNEE